jgi:hypothetical protein
MNTTKRTESTEVPSHRTGILTCDFDDINHPGLYIEHRSGTLLRIPEDAVVPGRSPVLQVVASEPWVVTKISDDPYLSLTKARLIAANLDLQVNF